MCKPSGKPSFVIPEGIEIAGIPAILAGTVNKSDIYIANGSIVFSRNITGGNGDYGEIIASTDKKAETNSALIALRTFTALL